MVGYGGAVCIVGDMRGAACRGDRVCGADVEQTAWGNGLDCGAYKWLASGAEEIEVDYVKGFGVQNGVVEDV